VILSLYAASAISLFLGHGTLSGGLALLGGMAIQADTPGNENGGPLMTSKEEESLMKSFFRFIAPPPSFLWRWIVRPFVNSSDQNAAFKVLDIYEDHPEVFKRLYNRWFANQSTDFLQQTRDRIIEAHAKMDENVVGPHQRDFDDARAELTQGLEEISLQSSPGYDIASLIPLTIFDQWDIDTPNMNNPAKLIESILAVYGFQNKGVDSWERTSLSYTS